MSTNNIEDMQAKLKHLEASKEPRKQIINVVDQNLPRLAKLKNQRIQAIAQARFAGIPAPDITKLDKEIATTEKAILHDREEGAIAAAEIEIIEAKKSEVRREIEAILEAVCQSARDDLNAAFKKSLAYFVDCISDESMDPAKVLNSIKPGPSAPGTIAWVQNEYLDERENTIELVGKNSSWPYMERLEACLMRIRRSSGPIVPEWAASAQTWLIRCREAEHMAPILQRLRTAGVIQ